MPAMSPAEIEKLSQKQIPEFVFDIVNKLLAETKRESKEIRQQDILRVLVEEKGFDKKYIFENKWLDFESYYESVGWNVAYKVPCYGLDEDDVDDIYWEFTKK